LGWVFFQASRLCIITAAYIRTTPVARTLFRGRHRRRGRGRRRRNRPGLKGLSAEATLFSSTEQFSTYHSIARLDVDRL
jgi:hypothetical protein